MKYRLKTGREVSKIPPMHLPCGLLLGDSNSIGFSSFTSGIDLPWGSAAPGGIMWNNWTTRVTGEDLTDTSTGRNKVYVDPGALTPGWHTVTADLGVDSVGAAAECVGPEYSLCGLRANQLSPKHGGNEASRFYGIVQQGTSATTWAGFTNENLNNLATVHPDSSREWTLDTTLSGGGETAVVVSEDLTAGSSVAGTGSLFIELDSGAYQRVAYSAVSVGSDTFTIASTSFSGDNATAGNRVLTGASLFENGVLNMLQFQQNALAASAAGEFRLAFDAAYVVCTGADAQNATGQEYAVASFVGNVSRFQRQLQRRLGLSGPPAVVGCYNIGGPSDDYAAEDVAILRLKIEQAERKVHGFRAIAVDDLDRQADGVHFTADGIIELGHRLAQMRDRMDVPIYEL